MSIREGVASGSLASSALRMSGERGVSGCMYVYINMHTPTNMHTHTRVPTRIKMHTNTHHILTHNFSTLTLSHSLTHAHTHTHTHSQTLTHAHTHTHTRKHARTRTHTHTHTHTLANTHPAARVLFSVSSQNPRKGLADLGPPDPTSPVRV